MGVLPPKSTLKKSKKHVFIVSWEMSPKSGSKTMKLTILGRDAVAWEQ